MAIVSVGTMLIAATTVFADIQSSINRIWRLRPKPGKGLRKLLINRLLSFSMVAGLGFLLMVFLLINTVVEHLMHRLKEVFPAGMVSIVFVLNIVITFCLITLLFSIIFKVLPDAVIRWKDVFAGALFTAFLFMAGRFAISFYIGRADIASSYGAAGALVVLVLWVYLSSTILYFGAAFTRAYALKYGREIRPNDYAVAIQVVELETKSRNLRRNDADEARLESKLKWKEVEQDQTGSKEAG